MEEAVVILTFICSQLKVPCLHFECDYFIAPLNLNILLALNPNGALPSTFAIIPSSIHSPTL